MRLSHARGNGTNANFSDQFDTDARMVIGILQIVN